MNSTAYTAISFAQNYVIKNAIQRAIEDLTNERVRYEPNTPERQAISDKIEALTAAYVTAADVVSKNVGRVIVELEANSDLVESIKRDLIREKIAEPRQLNSPLDPNAEIKYSDDRQMVAEAIADQLVKVATRMTDWGY